MNKEFPKPVLSAYFFRRGLRSSLGFFYVFLFITVSFTAYLYGLIEIDSRRVIIRILPTHLNPNENEVSNKNFINKKIVYHDDDVDAINDNDYISDGLRRDLKNILHKNSNDVQKKSLFEPNVQVEYEKNITKLFGIIERQKYQIRTSLRSNEALTIAELKLKYETLIKDKQDKLKEEFREELKRKNINQEPSDFNDTLADNYEEITLMTKLDGNDVISRDVLIRFLKYEKFKRKLKKSAKSIQSLLNTFDLKKELDLK